MAMTDTNNEPEINSIYLATALCWLRLRLERLAQRTQRPAPVLLARSAQETPSQRVIFWHHPRPLPALPAPKVKSPALDEQIEHYALEMSAAESADKHPALIVLGNTLGLSSFERNVLLLCIAMELDTRIANLCARAQDDPNK